MHTERQLPSRVAGFRFPLFETQLSLLPGEASVVDRAPLKSGNRGGTAGVKLITLVPDWDESIFIADVS